MQRYIFTERKRSRIWFLPALLFCGLLVVLVEHLASRSMETHVNGVAAHVGFSEDWLRRFPVGQPLKLAADRTMPVGYERIYLQQYDEIIGSLPESPLTMKVRKALADRQPVRVQIASVDMFDPARGIRVSVSFGQLSETSTLVARAF